jgi:acyl-[acyl carrier protein]--UDP-N-acetylglucosamine O-acyltransferase
MIQKQENKKMGLNISGLVIDKNYENNISELESILGQKLVFEKEVSFEEALENWKEDTYCDIYFT